MKEGRCSKGQGIEKGRRKKIKSGNVSSSKSRRQVSGRGLGTEHRADHRRKARLKCGIGSFAQTMRQTRRLRRQHPNSITAKLPGSAELLACQARNSNPAGSVKETVRPIVVEAKSGMSKPNDTLIEHQARNASIALAMAKRPSWGYQMVLRSPPRASVRCVGTRPCEYGASSSARPEAARKQNATAERGDARDEGRSASNQFASGLKSAGIMRDTRPEIWRDTKGRSPGFVSNMGATGTLMQKSAGHLGKPKFRSSAVQPERQIPSARKWRPICRIYEPGGLESHRAHFAAAQAEMAAAPCTAENFNLTASPFQAGRERGGARIGQAEPGSGRLASSFATGAAISTFHHVLAETKPYAATLVPDIAIPDNGGLRAIHGVDQRPRSMPGWWEMAQQRRQTSSGDFPSHRSRRVIAISACCRGTAMVPGQTH